MPNIDRVNSTKDLSKINKNLIYVLNDFAKKANINSISINFNINEGINGVYVYAFNNKPITNIKESTNVLSKYLLDNKFAKGFLSPPSKTKGVLFNFNAIKSWTNCKVERLHYGDIVFKNGFNHNKIKFLGNSWENSNLRNLHFCFLKRSSREKEKIVARNAPFEIGKNRYLKSQILYFAYLMISLIKGNMKLKSLFYLLKKNERL